MNAEELYTFSIGQYVDENSPFHIFSIRDDVDIIPHTHKFIEIIYILDGVADEQVDDKSYTVSRGDVIFIGCGSAHKFVAKESVSYVNILFRPKTLNESNIPSESSFALLQLSALNRLNLEKGGGMVSFSGVQRDEIEALISEMQKTYDDKEYKLGNSLYTVLLNSYMNIFLIKILQKSLAADPYINSKQKWRWLAEYIDNHLDEKISTSFLAKKFFYNPSYFSRVFKEHFGISSTDYINKRRCERAIKLLGETNLSIDKISKMVGYASLSSFYRAFTKITGSSPTEYRKLNKEQQ